VENRAVEVTVFRVLAEVLAADGRFLVEQFDTDVAGWS
jgi:hypothetical protein